MLPDLTDKQQRLYHYLEKEIGRNGRAPSLRKTAADLGISHAAVAQLLKTLEEKGRLRREGRYSRTIRLLPRTRTSIDPHRFREVPIIGGIRAGLPMYAQQEWDGTVVLDADLFGQHPLFALRIKGDSMRDAGILDGDIAICTPRQYAANGEIVVALIRGEEATVKRFFLMPDAVELRPENTAYQTVRYGFDDILIQGKVIGIQRGPDVMARLNP
ncbi:MAG TPA: transcriptional repressor LexA [Desulfosarcina sp.]|nr:transcriptional repressor LexA [Desulfosarcina sp.]